MAALNDQNAGHPTDDFAAAMAASQEWGDKIPIGIFYQKEKPTFTEQMPALQKGPLTGETYDPDRLRDLLSSQ